MIKTDDQILLNLPEQVDKNTKDIAGLKNAFVQKSIEDPTLSERVSKLESETTSHSSAINSNTNKIGILTTNTNSIKEDLEDTKSKVATKIIYNEGLKLVDKNGSELSQETPIKLGNGVKYDSESNSIIATNLLDDIVDSQGRKRYLKLNAEVDANGFLPNCDVSYNVAYLNGYELNMTTFFKTNSSISEGFESWFIGIVGMPNWVYNKLITNYIPSKPSGNTRTSVGSFPIISCDDCIQVGYVYIFKALGENNISSYATITKAIPSGTMCRFFATFVIDND